MILGQERCKELTDSEIVSLSRKDLDYFSCLYQRFEPELVRYIRRIAGLDEEEIQDILQDSFVKIWRNLNEFDDTLKLSSWIYRIVHNETISNIRKKRSFGKDRTIDAELYANMLTEESGTGSVYEKPDRPALEVLEQLPLKYREVLILKFLEQKNYREISDILRIPEGTVAVRINRAKKKFKGIYSKEQADRSFSI